MVEKLYKNLYSPLVENIGGIGESGGAQPQPPIPIQYLTAWRLVGNSEVHDNEIWSCGEYSAVDGKWHILVQPLGGSIVDIALTKSLRKVNSVADIIEFPSEQEGKALVTRNLGSFLIGDRNLSIASTYIEGKKRMSLYTNGAKKVPTASTVANILCSRYQAKSANQTYSCNEGISVEITGSILIYDANYNTDADIVAFKTANADTEVIYELPTPTTSLVDVSPIEESTEYSMVISQGAKAVAWTNFTPNPE